MYRCNLMEKSGLKVRWNDIYWGLLEDIISLKSIYEYIDREWIYNENSVIEEILIDLDWEKNDKMSALNHILRIINIKESLNELEAIRKWRYCILKDGIVALSDENEILKFSAEVYADFNYPEEMRSFIYYMESVDGSDPSKHSVYENRVRMVKNLHEFLRMEYDSLKKL
jgi:hypothetical protein